MAVDLQEQRELPANLRSSTAAYSKGLILVRAMTDASISVTQSVVEQFTERYLRSIGCSVERRDDRWLVSVPDDIDTEITHGRHTLVRGRYPTMIARNGCIRRAFFQQLPVRRVNGRLLASCR